MSEQPSEIQLAPPVAAAEPDSPLVSEVTQAPPAATDPPKAPPRAPVNVRSMTLVVLTVLAVLVTLQWASAFFIPLMLGFMLSYALSPVINVLERRRIPRAISSAVLLIAILGGLGASAWAFSDDANQLIESLPEAAEKLNDAVRAFGGGGTTPLETMQVAASKLEQAAEEAGAAAATGRGVQRVVIERARFRIRDHLWSGTMGLVSFAGQTALVTFLTYFLLISGDTFRRKLVKITGPSMANKKITVQTLDEITAQIQRYLLVQLLASVLVGVATGLAFWALGFKHATVWGFAAAFLNLVPYIGSVVVTGAAALVAFMQFGEVRMALVIAGTSLVIHTLIGNLLTPWLTSRASSMNPVAVFVAVLFWGWLWGVWGLLLGIPILMIVKAVCDRVDDLKPVGELLGA